MHPSLKPVVVGAVAALAVLGSPPDHAQTRPTHVADRLANVAPQIPPPSPTAEIRYQSVWGGAVAPARGITYCVYPRIVIVARPGSRVQQDWTTPFTLELVDAAGTPTAARFVPVAIPTPIPVGTTRQLLPSPKWCATTDGAKSPPELYLRVKDRRDRVFFAPAIEAR